MIDRSLPHPTGDRPLLEASRGQLQQPATQPTAAVCPVRAMRNVFGELPNGLKACAAIEDRQES